MNILLTVFGGNTTGNALSSGFCRVSPLVTANVHILDALAIIYLLHSHIKMPPI